MPIAMQPSFVRSMQTWWRADRNPAARHAIPAGALGCVLFTRQPRSAIASANPYEAKPCVQQSIPGQIFQSTDQRRELPMWSKWATTKLGLDFGWLLNSRKTCKVFDLIL